MSGWRRASVAVSLAALAQDMGPRDDLSPADMARVEAVTEPTADFSSAEKFEGNPAGAGTVTMVGGTKITAKGTVTLAAV